MLIVKFNNNNENKVDEFEIENNIKLPSQYKEFLEKYNGGFTPNTNFKKGKISSDIRAFYGLGDVKYSINSTNIEKWLNNNYLPIACDSFGNIILIGVSENKFGRIYFWEHENEKENAIVGVSDSFIDFIKLCKSKEISEATKRSVEEREALLIARGHGGNITDVLRETWKTEIEKYANMVQEEVKLI